MMKFSITAAYLAAAFTGAVCAGNAFGAAHSSDSVKAHDQDVSNGIISAKEVVASQNGWLVVHKTDGTKPGPVVGHAPLRAGMNMDVAAILTEPASPGDKFMLMIHSEAGGTQTGIFEYTLGAKEDGPIKPGGKLVMKIVTAK
ncbi:MAG: DUF7282 domain-containing protein [Pikeienuella sp.]